MAPATVAPDKDWAASVRGFALAWGLPILVIIGGFYFAERAQAVIWSLALIWMGIACIATMTAYLLTDAPQNL